IVASPEVCGIFQATRSFGSTAPCDLGMRHFSIQYLGVVNSRWRLYQHPLLPVGQMLMGAAPREGHGLIFMPKTLVAAERSTPRTLYSEYAMVMRNEGADYARI